MISLLMAALVLAAVVAVFATTRAGSGLAARLGLRSPVSGAASGEDVEFLLTRCGGDPVEVARRIAAERERFPALGEADHYRRAIRRLLNEQRGQDPSAPGL